MMNLKHIGRVISTGRKCLVAYRTLPGDAYNCLIIPTENLTDSYHDALINLVESPSGQDAYEFAEALARTQFPDGSTMLPSLHVKGKLIKVPTDAIEMVPNNTTNILLSELNQLIAEQRGVAIDDLALKPETEEPEPAKPVTTNPVVTEPTNTVQPVAVRSIEDEVKDLPVEEQAKKYRSEADRLSKEASKYRKIAEELSPNPQTIKRRAVKKVAVES